MNTSESTPVAGPGDESKISQAVKGSEFNDKELSRKLGVSVSCASSYRYGHRKPAAGNLSKLARVLGVSVQELQRDE